MPELSLNEGLLTKRISVYNPATGSNELNEPTSDPVLALKVWAELNPKSSQSGMMSQRFAGEGTKAMDVWRVRYNARITEAMQIKWNEQWWRIDAIDILGAKVAMDIRATRIE